VQKLYSPVANNQNQDLENKFAYIAMVNTGVINAIHFPLLKQGRKESKDDVMFV
jgi:hypothetical protein